LTLRSKGQKSRSHGYQVCCRHARILCRHHCWDFRLSS